MSVTEDISPQAKTELRHARMLIDGSWVDSLSGATLTVENPAKRKPIAMVPRGDAADVNGAVEAAARAFPAWRHARQLYPAQECHREPQYPRKQ